MLTAFVRMLTATVRNCQPSFIVVIIKRTDTHACLTLITCQAVNVATNKQVLGWTFHV